MDVSLRQCSVLASPSLSLSAIATVRLVLLFRFQPPNSRSNLGKLTRGGGKAINWERPNDLVRLQA